MSLLKNMPMPTPSLVAKERRFDRVMAQHKLRQRLAKLRGEDKPNQLDAQIHSLVRQQDPKYQRALSMLYRGWVTYNGMHFGGRLQLPILKVAKLKHADANCGIYEKPCVITFDRDTLLSDGDDELLDTLLHEMVHQCIAQHEGPAAAWCAATLGHHARFAEIANKIAKQRGWPDCSVKDITGPCAARFWPPRKSSLRALRVDREMAAILNEN